MFLNPPPAGCFLELAAARAYIAYCEAINDFSKCDVDNVGTLAASLATVLSARDEYLKAKAGEDSMLQELDDFMATAIKTFEPSKARPEDVTYFPNCKYIKRTVDVEHAPPLVKSEEGDVVADSTLAAKDDEPPPVDGSDIIAEDTSTHAADKPNGKLTNHATAAAASLTHDECCLAVELADGSYELYPLLTLERVVTDDGHTPLRWTSDQVAAHEVTEMDALTFGVDISPTSAADIVPYLCVTFVHEMTLRARGRDQVDVKAKKADKLAALQAKVSVFMDNFPKTKAAYDVDTTANKLVLANAKRDIELLETVDLVAVPATTAGLSTCMLHLNTYLDTLNARREQFAAEFKYYTAALLQVVASDGVLASLQASYMAFFTRELHALWKEKCASLEILYLLLRSMAKAAAEDPDADGMQAPIRQAIAAWEAFTWPDLTRTTPFLTKTETSPLATVKPEPTIAVDELKGVIETTLSHRASAKAATSKPTKPLTLVVYHPVCIHHETPPEHPESPERLKRAIAVLKPLTLKYPHALSVVALSGTASELAPPETTLLLVHSPHYLDQLKDRSTKVTRGALVFETDPGDDNDGVEAAAPDTIRPFAAIGGAFKVAASIKKDSAMDTYVSAASWDVARIAAGTVCLAVDKVLAGEFANAVCLVRPPGHHVGRNGRTPTAPSSGFCLLNNVVIGALHARMHPSVTRVAVLDWDIHHGNGTEELLRGDPRSFFASIHLYHNDFFPGTGPTASDANIVNVGLQNAGLGSGSEYDDWLLFPAMEAFQPDIIFISAGFDGHKDDILGGCAAVSNRAVPAGYVEADYAWATKEVLKIAERHCQGRVVSVLEGGYDVRDETNSLAKSIESHIDAIVEGVLESAAAKAPTTTADQQVKTEVKVEPKVEGRLAQLLSQNLNDASVVIVDQAMA
ncbi:hypothetical protein DYB38_007021 [Aphanomyces astaci]|uniref:histone deacetylase n=1 Tax=Aphanomyces astaci TaxID=112090 RepID=A0A397CAP0_APHAT|nr:hypothetical protein DYB38_007021 [Aphanomyces astaci]